MFYCISFFQHICVVKAALVVHGFVLILKAILSWLCSLYLCLVMINLSSFPASEDFFHELKTFCKQFEPRSGAIFPENSLKKKGYFEKKKINRQQKACKVTIRVNLLNAYFTVVS